MLAYPRIECADHQRPGNVRLGLKGDLRGHLGPRTPRCRVKPILRHVQRAIHQRTPARAGVSQEDTDLAMRDLPDAPGILAFDPARVIPLLGEAAFVQDQNTVRMTQGLGDHRPHVGLDSIGVPAIARQNPLHPSRMHMSGVLRELPAVLALRIPHQTMNVLGRVRVRRGSLKATAQPIEDLCDHAIPRDGRVHLDFPRTVRTNHVVHRIVPPQKGNCSASDCSQFRISKGCGGCWRNGSNGTQALSHRRLDWEWAFLAPYLTLMTSDAPQRNHDLR